MRQINTIFFDMDGVLMLSEPFWRIAEDEVFKREFGIDLSDDDVNESTGLKTTEVVELHKSKYGIDCDNEIIGHEIEKLVIEQVYKSGEPTKGLKEITKWVDNMNWRRCLVTSSSKYVYEHIVKFVGLDDFFERKFTAYDEKWGKPHPAVYQTAINYVGESKENIVVIEDSMNGVKAAHAAGLKILALPEDHYKRHEEYLGYVEKAFNSHLDILDYLKDEVNRDQKTST